MVMNFTRYLFISKSLNCVFETFICNLKLLKYISKKYKANIMKATNYSKILQI